MRKKREKNEIAYWMLSEASLYAFLYYVQYLLRHDGGNLWISSLLLWLLINTSILFCPVLRACHRGSDHSR